MPPSAFFRKAKLYADADVEAELVEGLRLLGVNIVSAQELGYGSRDDRFQLAEAQRQGRFLLTKNSSDFLNDRRFPMQTLQCGIVVLVGDFGSTATYLDAIRHLFTGVIPYGETFERTKVTLTATSVTIKHHTHDGKIGLTRFEFRGGQYMEVE